ncbi:putative prophage phiRv2 integrase [Actinoplanes italicus]|uniref:Site-specific recombinase XerD n=1 Tax=Actinoplanes italicus TaxID=113567 RepID=A0A2T0K0C1_9ACTN|nr:site-specific integrase [Actinoplanes italicus]PRX15983.1 site-specific recombinase XerD [Actinoplanes italicus]GIE32258.1 putative prophage phiRv2 integrase [Actinoplanes italicus]
MAKRRFGMLRKLPSGRYQASFINPAGVRQNAPDTFKTKTDANRWLTLVEADLSRGTWLDDRAAAESLGNYMRAVLRDSPKIGVRWRETCERNMRLHLSPLVDTPLRALTATQVREWHAAALRGKGGRTSISQSYRFLRMVLNVAVREGLIARSPCQIPGAGVVHAAERPIATPAQVVELVEAINPRYRTAVLIAAWCGLRRGEIAGLRVADVDLTEHTITVRKNRVEPLHDRGKAHDKDPKTKAGKRTVAIPPHVIPIVRLHLDEYAGRERLFVSRDGSPLRGNTLYQAFVRARKKVGLDMLTVHDLRHTGQTLAAQAGATMADLMKRLGHSSMAAARRYLHAVDGRDQEIAKALSVLAAHGDAARLPESVSAKRAS